MRRIYQLQSILLLLSIVFIITLPCESARADNNKADAMIVNKVKVKIINAPNTRKMYRKMAQRLIDLKSGEQLTAEKIEACLNALSLSNRFETIHVDTESTPKGENVIFTLKPYRFIKEIVIKGNYPLFEKDVLRQMTIYSGDVFRPEELPKQAAAIKERFRREGYVDPKVEVTTKAGTKTDNVTIQIEIKRGQRYLPGRLVFTGNRAIGVTLLKPRMKTWRTGLLLGAIRFTESRLKEDIDRLKTYYREKGYCEIEITYELDKKSRFPKVDVRLHISEGPRYKIAFEGNYFFSNYTLKKDLVLYKEGNRHGLGLRKSIANIKSRYLKSGFMDVKISARSKVISNRSGDTKEIYFVIEEGGRTIVSYVTLKGNTAIAEKKIREQILTRSPGLFHSGAFQQEILDEDTFAIETLYLNEGYQDAKVNSQIIFTQDRTGVVIEIEIEEGQQTRTASVDIVGSDLISLKMIDNQLKVKPGKPFRNTLLKSDEDNISRRISEKGYPHVNVKSKVKFNANRTLAEVVYEVDPGPRVHLGQIFVSGNLKTKEKIILRELDLKPDEPLSLQKMVDGQRALRDLDIFRSVQFKSIGLKEKEDTVNLFVEVQESKPYYAQTSVGYRSDTKGTASIKLGDNNFLGLNKSISGYGEVSSTGYELRSMLYEPRLLDSKTSANLSLYYKFEQGKNLNKTFDTEEYGTSLGFGRQWTEKLDSTLSFALKQIKTTNRDNPEDPPFRTLLETVPNINYDNRDSFIKPTKGGVVSLSINVPKGFEDSNDDFVKYRLGLSYYLTPIEKITLAWQGRFGHIEPYGGNKYVPGDQLFYLGGTNTVRGFGENLLRRNEDGDAVGGRTSIFGSFEIRLDIGGNWELATFYDTGSVQNGIYNTELKKVEGSDDFRSSVGAGLRYITPVGPIGLLYGHKLEVREEESPGRWHFSIGYTF